MGSGAPWGWKERVTSQHLKVAAPSKRQRRRLVQHFETTGEDCRRGDWPVVSEAAAEEFELRVGVGVGCSD